MTEDLEGRRNEREVGGRKRVRKGDAEGHLEAL